MLRSIPATRDKAPYSGITLNPGTKIKWDQSREAGFEEIVIDLLQVRFRPTCSWPTIRELSEDSDEALHLGGGRTSAAPHRQYSTPHTGTWYRCGPHDGGFEPGAFMAFEEEDKPVAAGVEV